MNFIIAIIIIMILSYILIEIIGNSNNNTTIARQNVKQPVVSLELQTLYTSQQGKVTVYDYDKLKQPTSRIIFFMQILTNMKDTCTEIKKVGLETKKISKEYVNFIEGKLTMVKQYVTIACNIYEELQNNQIFKPYEEDSRKLIDSYNEICILIENFKMKLLMLLVIQPNNDDEFLTTNVETVKCIEEIEQRYFSSIVNLQKNITENDMTFQYLTKLDNDKFKESYSKI